MHKLMIITHDLDLGGLQQVVVNLCKFINRDIFDISVLCLRNLGIFTQEVENMGIKVTLLKQKKNGTDYFSFLKVARILRQEKIDVIHTHNTQPFIDGTMGALLSGVKTIVHTDHARAFPDKKRYMFAEWLMSHFAYKIVGVSDHTCNNLIKHEKISPKKILSIPNGINATKFDIIIDKEAKKKGLGISLNGPVIGLSVRLAEQKGIIYLLKAMPEIIKFFPDVTLVIAGEGHLENELKTKCSSLGISNNVLFVGPRLDIPDILKLLDIYILPSLWEGLPIVLLEAMAAGCPIIATDVGGVSAAVQDKTNGILIRPNHPKEISDAVIKLLRDEALRKEFARNGNKLFRKQFTADIMAKKYEELYLHQS